MSNRPRPTNHICLLQANNGPDLLTIYVYSRLITVNSFSVTNLGQIVLGCAWACTLRPLRVTSKERWLMCSSFPILHHIKERHFRRRPATEANYRLHISWVSEFSIWKSHSSYSTEFLTLVKIRWKNYENSTFFPIWP